MRQFKKYLPWVLAFVAIAGLYLQYQSYRMKTGDCDCDKVKEYSAL